MNSHTPLWHDSPRICLPRGGRPIYGVPGPGPKTEDWQGSSAMWSLDVLLRILVEPVPFFRERRQDCAFSSVAAFCMVHALVATTVGYVAGVIGQIAAGSGPANPVEIAVSLSIMALTASAVAVLSLVVTVTLAAVLHPLAMVLRGRGGFQATYAAVVYSLAPVSVTLVLAIYVSELMTDSEAARITAQWLAASGVIWSLALFGVAITTIQPLDMLSGVIVACIPVAAVSASLAWLGDHPGHLSEQIATARRYATGLVVGAPQGWSSGAGTEGAEKARTSKPSPKAQPRRAASPRPHR